jgi:DNA polymerase I
MSEKILIIDAMNTFIRNYVMNPSLAADGAPIGGTKGFLMTMQKLVREIEPSNVIVVWDGGGGSAKRRALAKQYKDGRKPLKLNRAYDGMSSIEESQNRYDQMKKTIEYLNDMPVIQFLIDDIEADDVIAYICRMQSMKGKVKIIVSMDKDFIQLCDDETMMYSPVQKEFINKKRVIEKYGIHPNNFAIARAIDGDKSDNLDGIKGAGLKTISKNLNFLLEEKSYGLDDLFKFCRTTDSDLKLYKNILTEKNKVELNYKLMQLYSPNISVQSSQHIINTVENFTPTFNRTGVLKMMSIDGIGENNWNSLFQKFRLMIDTFVD